MLAGRTRVTTDRRRHVPPGHVPGRQTRRRASPLRSAGRLVGWLLGAFSAVVAFLGILDTIRAVVGLPWDLFDQDWLLVLGSLVAVAWGTGCWWLMSTEDQPEVGVGGLLHVEDVELVRGSVVAVTIDPDAPHAVADTAVGLVATELADVPVSVFGRVDSDGAKLPMCVTRAHRIYESWEPVSTEGSVMLRVPAHLPPSYEGAHLSIGWAVALRDAGGRLLDELPVWVRP